MAAEMHKRYLLGDLVLEPKLRHLSKGGVPVHLTRKPFQVLLYLVEHHDRLVTRRELLEQFWEGHDVYDETLTKCVGAIRKALDDQTERPRFIETHWSEGYRFVCQVEEQLIPPEPTVVETENTSGVKIGVAGEVHLFENAASVSADRLDRQAHFVGDVGDRFSGCELDKNLKFAVRQLSVRRSRCIAGRGKRQRFGERRTHVFTACGYGTDRLEELIRAPRFGKKSACRWGFLRSVWPLPFASPFRRRR